MTRPTVNNFKKPFAAALVAMATLVPATLGFGQYRADHIPDGPPVTVANPTIVARPNAQLPLDDTEFTKSDGSTIKLRDLFSSGKPVILTMVYFSCPALCGMTQNSLVNAVRQGPRSLELGKDYEIVVVSIDPDDTPALATTKRNNYLTLMSRPPAQPGFTYLTGTEPNIRKLADAIGFGYRRNYEGEKFLHSAGIFVNTPYGRLSKTIVELNFTPDELHASLLAAADNKIGSGILETIALPCGAMRLNPMTGRYEHNPWFWAGTAGASASILFMTIFLGTLWRGEYKKYKQQRAAGATAPTPLPH